MVGTERGNATTISASIPTDLAEWIDQVVASDYRYARLTDIVRVALYEFKARYHPPEA